MKQFQFKLVLLGESGVGKSCLVLRFVRGEFSDDQVTTIGGKCQCAAIPPLTAVTPTTCLFGLLIYPPLPPASPVPNIYYPTLQLPF